MLSGGEEEDRTPDLRIANATLSQLSYPPTVAPSLPNRQPILACSAGAIVKSVKALDGTARVRVDLVSHSVEIETDHSQLQFAGIKSSALDAPISAGAAAVITLVGIALR
jgi:hypothetical protein